MLFIMLFIGVVIEIAEAGGLRYYVAFLLDRALY
jgi:hypothetical protein